MKAKSISAWLAEATIAFQQNNRLQKQHFVVRQKLITKSILFLLLIYCTGKLQAQSASTKNNQAVQQTVMLLFDALSNRDSISLKNQCAAEVRFYEYGQIWTIDTLINKAIAKNVAADFKRTNKLDFINTTVTGNAAWTTYYLFSELNSNGKNTSIHWMETAVLSRTGGKWKIQLLHSTLISRN